MDPIAITTLVTTASGSSALKRLLDKIRRDVSDDVDERQSALLDVEGDEATKDDLG